MLKPRRLVSLLLVGLLLSGPLWAQSDPFLSELPKLQNLKFGPPDLFRAEMKNWRAKAESWPPGEAKAKLWLLLADDCQKRGDRQGEIDLLREAVTYWKDRPFLSQASLRLAFVLLKDNQVEASRGAVDQALAAMPADPPPLVLELLLQQQREEAQRRGDAGVEFSQLLLKDSLHGGKELRDSLALAQWYRERNLPDGQLLWWNRSLERVENGTRMTPAAQWISLWQAAPAEKKEWAEQKLLSVASELAANERARLFLSMTRSLSFENVPMSRKLAFVQPLRDILREGPNPELELEIEQQLIYTYGLINPEEERKAAIRALELAAKLEPSAKLSKTIGGLYFTAATASESLQQNSVGMGYFQRGLAYVLINDPDQAARFFIRAIRLAKSSGAQPELANLRATLLEQLNRIPESSRGMALESLVQSYGESEAQEKLAALTRQREYLRGLMETTRQQERWDDFAQAGRSLATTHAAFGDRRSQRLVLESLLQETLPRRTRQIVQHELFGCLQPPADDAFAEKLAAELLNYPSSNSRLLSVQNIVSYRFSQKNYQEAWRLLDSVEVRNCNHSGLIESRWLCLRWMKRWPEAWQALEAWEKAFPSEAKKNAISNDYARAALLQDQGRWDDSAVWMDKAFAQVLVYPVPWQASRYIQYLNQRKLPWRESFDKALAAFGESERIGLILNFRKLLGDDESRKLLIQRQLDQSTPRDRAEVGKYFPDLLKSNAAINGVGGQPALGAVLDQVRLARPELGNLITLRSTNIAPLQSHLRPGQWLVSYVPTGVDLLVVMLSQDQALYERLPLNVGFLERQIDEDWRRLADGKNVNLDQWSNQLIRPIFDKVKPRELLIVPIGGMWKLPFAALKSPDGAYLSEKTLCLLTSGDLLRLADGHWTNFGGGEFVAAGAPPDADLPGAEAELAAIHRSWPASNLLSGRRATAKALLDWPTKIEMLHLATHTRVRGDDPLNSSVELHQSKLTLAQLFKLPLSDHALVVLSSCRGGLGQNASASEPVSLASALAASGAQSVIANLWDADDEASKLFFSSFYAELRRHGDLSKSFLAAQKATRLKFPDPFYWAGFCLIGSPH